MHILNVIQCSNLGGMEQASLGLMKALKLRGHTIELVSLNKLGALKGHLDDAEIPAIGLGYGEVSKARFFLSLRRLVRRSTADALIMTGHNFLASLAMLGVGPERRILSMHFHHQGVLPRWQWKMIYGVARRQFQAITFPTDFVRLEAQSMVGSIEEFCITIPNPIAEPVQEAADPGADFRIKNAIPLDVPLIGNAGWLIPRKRFDVFLRVASKILKKTEDAHFVIAGDGEQRIQLERIAENLGLEHRVRFVGWLSDLRGFYSAIDVLLFNSDWDALGLTPVEAIVRKVPVVCSIKNGGLSELLTDDFCWIFDDHDENALAASVLDALSEEGSRRAARGASHILDMCEPSNIAERIEALLNTGSKI